MRSLAVGAILAGLAAHTVCAQPLEARLPTCFACHGENAVGGGTVPDLRASSFLGNDFFYEIVLNGAMKDAGMASFKPVLDQKDATAIRAYLIKRANDDKAAVGNASTK